VGGVAAGLLDGLAAGREKAKIGSWEEQKVRKLKAKIEIQLVTAFNSMPYVEDPPLAGFMHYALYRCRLMVALNHEYRK
jgi:hypothetical protein